MKKPNIFILLICILNLSFYNKAFAIGQGQTEIRINVPSRTLSLYKNSYLIGEYSVGVGHSQAMMTPQGYYKVEKKVIDPIWEHPYKPEGAVRISNYGKNPLGQRWIGFFEDKNTVYGIHGTNDPKSIGKFVSHGCVRMNNLDVEEIFDLVDIGDTVHVTYNRFELSQDADSIMLEIFPDPYKIKALNETEIINEIVQIAPNIEINHNILKQALAESNESNIYEVGKIIKQPQYSAFPYNQAPNNSFTNHYYSNYISAPVLPAQFQQMQMPIIYQPSNY